MDKKRLVVSLRRHVATIGLVEVLLLTLLARYLAVDAGYNTSDRRDILFGASLSDYPSWIANGLLPLDVVVGTVMLYGLMYVLNFTANRERAKTVAGQVPTIAIVSIGAAGGAFGIMGSAMSGWYVGIGYYIVGGLAACVITVGVAVIVHIVLGIVQPIREHYRRHAVRRSRPIRTALRRFYAAEDIPSTKESPDA